MKLEDRVAVLETMSDIQEKALCALIRAILDQGADITALIEKAEADLISNFKEGHAITISNQIRMAHGLVGGWFRKSDPALDDPSSDVKEWPRR